MHHCVWYVAHCTDIISSYRKLYNQGCQGWEYGWLLNTLHPEETQNLIKEFHPSWLDNRYLLSATATFVLIGSNV